MQPPYGYGPPAVPVHDPNRITATDIILPFLLSMFCGFGGFVWGLVRMTQGHHRPGWIAMGINAGVCVLGIIGWVILIAIGAAAGHGVAPVHS